jgi:hypothetical protein
MSQISIAQLAQLAIENRSKYYEALANFAEGSDDSDAPADTLKAALKSAKSEYFKAADTFFANVRADDFEDGEQSEFDDDFSEEEELHNGRVR